MCRRAGEGRFIGCAQLLLVWFHGHFWKVDKVSYRVFSESYSPLKEEAAMQRRDDILEERWTAILQNLKEEDVEWRAFWMVPDEVLYRCESFDWVPLLEILGAVGYAPLLVLRLQIKAVYAGDARASSIRCSINGGILASGPKELEIIRQDFEKKNSELSKKIEQLEEEQTHLRLDIDYKKLRLSMRTAGLGKTSEQWRQEIREEKIKADRWERKFQEPQT
ncbi:hypothetical protein PVK06_027403 [Gossypium arboreum]|uniref:DUF7745 domain-containing protein n=1 Tax=Gossypium arboreum TaxID=29729 RepID=A0ABR0P1G7_GOSAR|nr:hypothetical protein PVK06_027403 [Gossypium arboreum]